VPGLARLRLEGRVASAGGGRTGSPLGATVMLVAAVIGSRRDASLVLDASLALVVAAVDLGQAGVAGMVPGEPHLTTGAVLLLLAQSAPLVERRRAPVVVWLVVAVLAAAYGIADYPDRLLPLAPLVALYTVLVQHGRRVALLVGLVSLGAGVGSAAAAGDSDAQDYLATVLLVGITVALALTQRARRAYLSELETKAEHLERIRAAEARRAVQDERVRIARELHDVVAHSVSMVVVQAEAAAVAAEPEARAALEAIGETARGALTELRRLLGVLRADDETALAPQPGVGQLDALVGQVRAAGLPVEVRVEGPPQPLPAGVDLSVFRIVQEALTNTLRHAGAAHATVVIRYRDGCVELAVTDDGSGAAEAAGADAGHGLVGIGERVTMLGGSLTAGPRPEGGFQVSTRLPIRG
jgi:signal transduction histidine kinase